MDVLFSVYVPSSVKVIAPLKTGVNLFTIFNYPPPFPHLSAFDVKSFESLFIYTRPFVSSFFFNLSFQILGNIADEGVGSVEKDSSSFFSPFFREDGDRRTDKQTLSSYRFVPIQSQIVCFPSVLTLALSKSWDP